MKQHALAFSSMLLAYSAPAEAKDNVLVKLLGALARPSNPSPSSSSSSRQLGTTQRTAFAAMSSAQTSALTRLLTQSLPDARVAADRASARQLIFDMLTLSACAQHSSAWNLQNRNRLTPATLNDEMDFVSPYAPMASMRYHDQSSCLDVTRIADWNKPANNALKFTVYFVSPQSGEAAHQTFELQHSTDGQWLIRNVDFAWK